MQKKLLLFLQIADLPSDISFSKTVSNVTGNKMLATKQTVISNSVIRRMPKE